MKRNYISRILRESLNHILKEDDEMSAVENDGSYHEYVDADKAQALAEVLDVDADSITNAV